MQIAVLGPENKGEPAHVVIGWCGLNYTTHFVLPASAQEGADVEKADDQEQDSAMPDEKEVSVNDGCCGQVNVRCFAFLGQKPLSRLRAASRTPQKKQRTCFAVKKTSASFCGFLAVLAAPACALM